MSLSLVGDDAQVAWRAGVNGSGAWSAPPVPLRTAAVAVESFDALCEVTLLAGASTPATKLDDAPLLRNSGAWGAAAGGAGTNATAAIDADLRSCVDVAASAGPLQVSLGSLHSISAVHLIPSAAAANVSVSVLPSAGADASGAVRCGGLLDLEPWRVAVADCGRDIQGGEVVVELHPLEADTLGVRSVLSVCDVAVRGRPG